MFFLNLTDASIMPLLAPSFALSQKSTFFSQLQLSYHPIFLKGQQPIKNIWDSFIWHTYLFQIRPNSIHTYLLQIRPNRYIIKIQTISPYILFLYTHDESYKSSPEIPHIPSKFISRIYPAFFSQFDRWSRGDIKIRFWEDKWWGNSSFQDL